MTTHNLLDFIVRKLAATLLRITQNPFDRINVIKRTFVHVQCQIFERLNQRLLPHHLNLPAIIAGFQTFPEFGKSSVLGAPLVVCTLKTYLEPIKDPSIEPGETFGILENEIKPPGLKMLHNIAFDFQPVAYIKPFLREKVLQTIKRVYLVFSKVHNRHEHLQAVGILQLKDPRMCLKVPCSQIQQFTDEPD